MGDMERGASVIGLLAEAQLLLLQDLSASLPGDFVGLSVASRAARRRGLISSATMKKIIRVDEAAHVVRHSTHERLSAFIQSVQTELSGGAATAAKVAAEEAASKAAEERKLRESEEAKAAAAEAATKADKAQEARAAEEAKVAAVEAARQAEVAKQLRECEAKEEPAFEDKPWIEESAEDCEVDASGIAPQDIELVMSQSRCRSRAKAVAALKSNSNDIAEAIMQVVSEEDLTRLPELLKIDGKFYLKIDEVPKVQ